MKEMWTGIFPNKKEYKYEIRFRTDNEYAYKLVQEACREAIDTDCANEMPAHENFKCRKHNDFKWIKINDNIYDLTENLLIEYKCSKCGKEYLFNINEMDWNDCGWFTCFCGEEVRYEKV